MIDALRGIAALWVVAMHFQTLIKEKHSFAFPFPLDWIISHGEVGVSIFFVLSGFVIAYSLRSTHLSWGAIGKFFVRRSLRLDPPYWAALFLLLGLILIGSMALGKGAEYLPSQSELFLNMAYLQSIVQVPTILPVSWTLCLEFQFYLVLALCLKGAQGFNRRFGKAPFNYDLLALFFPSCLFLISLFFASHLQIELPLKGTFIPFWYSFYLGCLLGWVLTGALSERHYVIALAALLLFYAAGDNEQLIVTGFISLCIYYCIKADKLYCLNWNWLQYLGRTSYSLYLIHWPIGIKMISLLAFLFPLLPPFGLFLFSLLATLSAAHLFYRWIEEPCLAYSKNFTTKTFQDLVKS